MAEIARAEADRQREERMRQQTVAEEQSIIAEEQRAVAELSFDFGYSYPEIAEILEIPVNTVKTRMYYARKSMQASLNRSTRRES